MKYCLAYDGSPQANVAGELLQALFKQNEDQAALYHGYPVTPESRIIAEELCRPVALQLQEGCGASNVEVVLRETGDVRADLMNFCEGNVDVLVMGSRGLGLLARTVLGSISTHALNHFKGRAIAIVHAPPAAEGSGAEPAPPADPDAVPPGPGTGSPAGRRYLVFADGSEQSDRAAELCAQWCQAGDAVKVVALYHYLPPAAPGIGFDPHVYGTAQEAQAKKAEMAAKAQAVVDATTELMRKARAGAPAVEITSAVAEVEDIKSGIVEHATEEAKADAPAGGHMPRTVIFMGSRGLGAVARFWLGSSTNYVLHHCELPLVVVH